MAKDTFFCPKMTLQCRGKIINLSTPKVMGILNISPDSFYDGGKFLTTQQLLKQAESMLHEGADIIDVGAVSTRPGAAIATAEEEQKRLIPAFRDLVREFPGAIWSIDTYHADTARKVYDEGAHIINDISAGAFDKEMFPTIASLQVPYIIMHIKGHPANMQENPIYNDLIQDVVAYFAEKLYQLQQLGVHDVVIDPGFGFGKTLEQNYHLLRELDFFRLFERPILAGISRKSMINKVLHTTPKDALNGTTVLNTLALERGASILRVHDVREARQAVDLVLAYQNLGNKKTAS